MAGGPSAAASSPPRYPRKVSLDLAERLATALDDLKSGNAGRVSDACAQLAVLEPPDAQRRAEVARLLAALLSDPDGYCRKRALEALRRWYTPEVMPAIIRAAEDQAFYVRWAAIDTLSEMKDNKAAAAAVAARIPGDRNHAVQAIKRMGSVAEDAVLDAMGKGDSWTLVWDFLEALEAVGGTKSLQRLTPYVNSKNFHIRYHVQRTVRAIQMRRMTR